MALKILHTADWHLGLCFASFGEDDSVNLPERGLTQWTSFSDWRRVTRSTSFFASAISSILPLLKELWWKGLLQLFRRRNWQDHPVFLLAGNRDPLQANSVWSADHAFRRALTIWLRVFRCEPPEIKRYGSASAWSDIRYAWLPDELFDCR